MPPELHYVVSPDIDNELLNRLFSRAWENHTWTDFTYLQQRSLGYVCGYHGEILVGFVNLAWDGNRHAFILDTTVDKQFQRQGIGRELVKTALRLAGEHNVEWVHVDYEDHLDSFYRSCGFEPTPAGLVRMSPVASP